MGINTLLNKFIGNSGEKVAEKYLISNGFEILYTQKKVIYIEVDIIAKKEDTLYFFEVKTMYTKNKEKIDNFFAEERVSKKKIHKLEIYADDYCNKHNCSGAIIGIIGVLFLDGENDPYIDILYI
ncbi:MAG: YraN family protein [Alphaproteobacteria bacterium]|nr:YraN family protein [Alphaproteobacteria bacterium]